MSYITIAPIGDNARSFFYGLKHFATSKAILIAPPQYRKDAHNLAKKLEEITIPTEIHEISANVLEDMFAIFGKILSVYDQDHLLVNVGTGDRISTCAALSASYANGLQAFGCDDHGCMMLPIMKLSYYRELSDNKLAILKALDAKRYQTVKELCKKLKMSSALLSYHINGNRRYKGLKEFRLVEVQEENKNLLVRLSEMGNLLLKGYIPPKQEH